MLDETTLKYALKRSRFKARTLIGKYGFTRDDLDDIHQDLLTDLVRRLDRFDLTRASIRTFISRVLEHGVADILERREAQCRDYRRSVCSLDDATEAEEGEWTTYAAQATWHDCRAHLRLDVRSESDLREIRMDVATVMTNLPAELRILCSKLTSKSVSEIARETGIHRDSLYRAIGELRRRFREAGLFEYLAPAPTGRSVGR